MGLDFTRIRDEPGSAIFFIHDGTEQTQQEFNLLKEQLSRKTKKQIITLSSKDGDGYQVVKFYNLRGSKFVLIVRDDDQLHHVWSDGERFDVNQIAYTAERAG